MRDKGFDVSESMTGYLKQVNKHHGCSWSCLILLFLSLQGLDHAWLRAGEVLQQVPADVSGVLVFRNLTKTHGKLESFLKKAALDHANFDLHAFDEMIGLQSGSIDTSKPITVIFFRPEELTSFFSCEGLCVCKNPYPAVAFTPRNPAAFMKKVDGHENKVRRQRGPESAYYLMMRDGVAFVCNKRKGLRMLCRVSAEGSLLRALNKDERRIYADSDIFVHFPLTRWREQFAPIIWMATNVMKMGLSAKQEPTQIETTQRIADWFIGGVREAIDQMKAITLSLQCDDQTLRLRHYHAFVPVGSASDYLRQIKRTKYKLWEKLPDQPFFLLGIVDWVCPPESSFTCRFNKFFFNSDLLTRELSPRKKAKLKDCSRACYGAIKGMQFMLTSPPGKTYPMQVLGGFAVDDADLIIKKHRVLQENAGVIMASFLPGGGHFGGNLKRGHRNGRAYFEQDMDSDALPELVRESVIHNYGKGVRYQETVAGKHYIIYSQAQPPWGTSDILRAIHSGKTADGNAQVQRIRDRLPRDANAVLIVDVGRLMLLAPHWVQAKNTENLTSKGPNAIRSHTSKRKDRVGPMLGWSCRVRPSALDCQWVMDLDDLVQAIQLGKRFAVETAESYSKAKSSKH